MKVKIKRLFKGNNVYLVDGSWLLAMSPGQVRHFTPAGWVVVYQSTDMTELGNQMLVRAAKVLRIDDVNS